VDWYVKELRLGFYDHEEVDVDANDLHQVVQAAHEDWKAGRKVLIRCQAGLNRSGLVTALVLARDGMPIDEAMELLRQRRSPAALYNPDFVDWLVANYHVFLDEK
jgi:protein-tyrosine phosphatase